MDSTSECGENSRYCLCAVTARACDHPDGLAPHTSSNTCVCGGNARLCNAETGLLCVAVSSTCSHAPPCADGSGATKNPGVCRCGSIDCVLSLAREEFAALVADEIVRPEVVSAVREVREARVLANRVLLESQASGVAKG